MATSTEMRCALDRNDRNAFEAIIDRRRMARMALVDAMSPQLRALVHEYGLLIVLSFLDVGVRKPKQIRHIVETILNEFSPTRGAHSTQGSPRAPGIGPEHPLAKG